MTHDMHCKLQTLKGLALIVNGIIPQDACRNLLDADLHGEVELQRNTLPEF